MRAAFACACVLAVAGVAAADPPRMVKGPYLQDLAPTSITVMWQMEPQGPAKLVVEGPGGSRTGYSVGTCSTLPPLQVHIGDSSQVRGTQGEPVQGHETRYVDEKGYRTLWILKAVHDAPVAVAGSGAQAELYAIANHLALPH